MGRGSGAEARETHLGRSFIILDHLWSNSGLCTSEKGGRGRGVSSRYTSIIKSGIFRECVGEGSYLVISHHSNSFVVDGGFGALRQKITVNILEFLVAHEQQCLISDLRFGQRRDLRRFRRPPSYPPCLELVESECFVVGVHDLRKRCRRLTLRQTLLLAHHNKRLPRRQREGGEELEEFGVSAGCEPIWRQERWGSRANERWNTTCHMRRAATGCTPTPY